MNRYYLVSTGRIACEAEPVTVNDIIDRSIGLGLTTGVGGISSSVA